MNKINKKGSVLIYTILLIFLAIMMLIVVQNNITSLYLDNETEKLETKLSNNIIYKSDLSVKYLRSLNSNGSGFVDIISCPSSITMSGNTLTSVISSSLTYSGNLYFCSGSYLSSNLKIYFNSGSTDFDLAEYQDTFTSITSGIGAKSFLDSDSTNIDFSADNYFLPDLYDDNFDSDNYIGNSTGALDYPNDYIDDDDLARREIFGYIHPNTGFTSIFWSNTKSKNIISENTNNTGSLTSLLGSGTGYLYLDIDGDFSIKVVEFDSNSYDTNEEMLAVDSITNTGFTESIGYIQNNGGNLSFSGGLTGNEYDFDFVNNDYAIFLENTGTGTILYRLKGENSSGSLLYINPIDDSSTGSIRILGSDILINDEGKYISKQLEIIKSK